MFLAKVVLKIFSKFTEEHPYRSMISMKLQSNCIEITLWHRCSLVNLLHVFRIFFYKNTYGGLLLICNTFAVLTISAKSCIHIETTHDWFLYELQHGLKWDTDAIRQNMFPRKGFLRICWLITSDNPIEFQNEIIVYENFPIFFTRSIAFWFFKPDLYRL